MFSEIAQLSARQTKDKKDKDDGLKIVAATYSSTAALITFSVEEGGTYTFNVEKRENAGHGLAVLDLSLNVRRNVMQAELSIYLPGFILLVVAGVIFLLLDGPRSIKESIGSGTKTSAMDGS